jgi:hypothetical protein
MKHRRRFPHVIAGRRLGQVFFAARLLLPLALFAGCAMAPMKPIFSGTEDALSCWALIETARGDEAALDDVLDQRIEAFQSAAEDLLATREQAIKVTRRALALAGPGQPLSPELMDTLRQSTRDGLDAMAPVDRTVAANLCWLDADPRHLSERKLAPLSPELRLKGVALELAALLMLYDTYATTTALLNEDKRIRHFLDGADLGYGITQDQLDALTAAMASRANLHYTRDLIRFYEANRAQVTLLAVEDFRVAYLALLIDQSPSFRELRKGSGSHSLDDSARTTTRRVRDDLRQLGLAASGGLSQVFGNSVGVVETREGRLARDAGAAARIGALLRPGDILIEKTPFRLTDKLIPGYFGHAALWLGSEAELTALGLWDDPRVVRYHEALRAGRTVLEALRSGVELNTLEHFLNIDDLLVLRDPSLTGERLNAHLIRAFRQIGKRYDFNFDVTTGDRIACSELIYLVFTDIPWETDRQLGRYTLSPDRVVENALARGDLEIVLLYIGGKLVTTDAAAVLRERMAGKRTARVPAATP